MSARSANVIVAAGLLVVAGYVVHDARSYPASVVPGSPGPGLFPALVGLLIGLLAVLLLVHSGRFRLNADDTDTGSPVRALAALALVLLFVATLESTDVFIGLAALLAAIMWLMGERRPAALVCMPALFDLFVYVVFFRVFGIPLPTVVF